MEQSYKEKYEQAIERARVWKDKSGMPKNKQGILDDIFPELAESEDEKARKELIKHLKELSDWKEDEVIPVKNPSYYRQWASWLEKQGDQIDIANKEYWRGYREGKKLILDKYAEQSEKKPADKVEPKFKVGDWITNGDYTWKIVEVKPLDYLLQSQNGNIVDDTISHIDEQFHSFTIADAKNGDVLYINNTVSESIMIYKSFNNGLIKKYASYNKFGFEGEHYLTLNDGYITPATKEQHDTLMKAMVDAGYTFDFENKKLKKIEPKPEENKGNIGGISANWSDVDEVKINRIVACLENLNVADNDILLKDVAWLKSIRPHDTWKPSDEQMGCLSDAIKHYNSLGYPAPKLKELLDDLKKLNEGEV